MAWSKTRKVLQEFRCDSLRSRIDIHSTNYRTNHAGHGRVWITLDGKEILSFRDCLVCAEGMRRRRLTGERPDFNAISEEIDEPDSFDFFSSLGEYLRQPVDASLSSSNELISMLAMFDRRLGKRRLRQIDPTILPERTKVAFLIRAEAEGIRLPASA